MAMKKSFLTLVVLLCFATAAMAEVVSPAAAREAAARFLQAQGATLTDKAQTPQRGGRVAPSADAPAYYVFNADASRGFVVVSGDDCVGDNLVLGYAAEGSYSETDAPDGLQWWLETTAESIARLSSLNARPARVALHDRIDPMLTSKWDQNLPYNAYCPVFSGQLSLTGCMATALAQVMRYHRWPQDPTSGTLPAYTMANGAQIPALPVTQFDWDNMVDNYATTVTTDAQKSAVAELMRYCGQSMQMNYTPQASDGYFYDIDILVNRFGYDPELYAARATGYTVSGWDELIYGELQSGRPLTYTAQSTGGGHAFVIDGYKVESGEGYYHVNWGWSGSSDGFYKISLLNANGSGSGASSTTDGYNRDQRALIGFQPRRNPSQPFYRHLFGRTWDTMDGATWHSFAMVNQSYKSGTFSLGIAERKEDGTPDPTKLVWRDDYEISGFSTASFVSGGASGVISLTIGNENAPYFFSGLTPGRHQCVLVSRLSVIGAPWEPVFGPNNYIEVDISATGGVTQLTVHPLPLLSAGDEDIKVEGPHQRALSDRLTATVSNAGSDDYIGQVECVAYPLKDGILQAHTSVSATGLMIEAGGTADVDFNVFVPQVGDYVVLLTHGGDDEEGLSLDDIRQAQGYIGHKCLSFGELEFLCTGAAYQEVTDEYDQPVYLLRVGVDNGTPMNYNAFLVTYLFHKNTSGNWEPVTIAGLPRIYCPLEVAAGEKSVAFLLLPEPLTAGEYMSEVQIARDFRSNDPRNYFVFGTVPFTVAPEGIEEVQISNLKPQTSNLNDVWYDLSGRKLSGKPDKKGVYIREGKKYLIP